MDTLDHIYPSTSRPRLTVSGGRSPTATRPSATTTAPGSAPTGRAVADRYDYPDGSVAADGEVLDIDPGAFVMSFHPRWDPEIEAEARCDDLGSRAGRATAARS